MALKLTFLGSGSAFTMGEDNYHSNVLIQQDRHSLLIDAGSDIRFSLYKAHLNHLDIESVYITHLHADHIGGLEWLALSTYFDTKYINKPHLYISELLIKDLWDKSLCGGLSTLQTEQASLDSFFTVHPIKKHEQLIWQNIQFKLVQAVHVISNYKLMPCYGLMFEYNQIRIYLTADTQYSPSQLLDYYEKADIIFHDCETSEYKSGVHAHYSELLQIPKKLRKKIWLYHYNPGKLPDAKADGFLGFVKRGQVFHFK